MDRYIIHGGTTLNGEVEISGAKNAAVAIIPAALLVQGVCRIENIPQISDTDTLLTILAELGARVSYLNKSTIEIDCTNARYQDAPYDLMRKIRASYYLIGSMLGRFGSAKTTMPGGCNFGVRPIDQHIKGMRALGAEINVRGGYVYADAKDGRLHGARIYLDKVSVGATMNIMIAGVLAEGRTVIENAAREPHIVDLANFLNSMGADVRGAGTDTIKINGVDALHGGTYTIIPDQIEAGTYMVAAAATGGEVLVTNIIPKHMEGISAKLREAGAFVEEYEEAILVKGPAVLRRINLKTMPYPGFPTASSCASRTGPPSSLRASMTTALNMSTSFAKWAPRSRSTGASPSSRAGVGSQGPWCMPAIFVPVRRWSSPAWWPAASPKLTTSIISSAVTSALWKS